MRGFLMAKGAIVVVAEAKGALAGFVIVQMEEVRGTRGGYVMTLDVASEWRRQGVATRLMEAAESKAAAAGAGCMLLHVFAGNAGAAQFYERRGYKQVSVAKSFYGRELDALVLWKALS
jgi:ribosomal-protein-alanine N-acetyltransferase